MNQYGKTILCVDDDEDDLSMLRQAISEIGSDYAIVEAFDGVHALTLLRELQEKEALPCLIVLDINMPRMDGKQTLIALQNDSEFSSIPVVLFSTSSSVLDKIFSETKNVDLLTKPINIDALYTVASKLLSYCKR